MLLLIVMTLMRVMIMLMVLSDVVVDCDGIDEVDDTVVVVLWQARWTRRTSWLRLRS